MQTISPLTLRTSLLSSSLSSISSRATRFGHEEEAPPVPPAKLTMLGCLAAPLVWGKKLYGFIQSSIDSVDNWLSANGIPPAIAPAQDAASLPPEALGKRFLEASRSAYEQFMKKLFPEKPLT